MPLQLSGTECAENAAVSCESCQHKACPLLGSRAACGSAHTTTSLVVNSRSRSQGFTKVIIAPATAAALYTPADVIKRVESALGGPLDEAPSIHCVRDVAPKKIMLCVSFRVPRAVAFAGRQSDSSQQQQQQQPAGQEVNGHQQQQQQMAGVQAGAADGCAEQPLSKRPKV